VRAPVHERSLATMLAAVEQELGAAATGGGRAAFGVDATRVARGPGGCLYRVDPPPEVTLVEDAAARPSVARSPTRAAWSRWRTTWVPGSSTAGSWSTTSGR
jgi:hypothetical protein